MSPKKNPAPPAKKKPRPGSRAHATERILDLFAVIGVPAYTGQSREDREAKGEKQKAFWFKEVTCFRLAYLANARKLDQRATLEILIWEAFEKESEAS